MKTENQIRIERKRAQQREAERWESLMRQARPIGEALGDGEQFDSYGEPYQSTTAAQSLAEKLTLTQMATLAEWLGVGE